MGPVEWMLLVGLSVLWGGAFFFYKVLDDAGLPPFTIAFARVSLGALALLAVVAALRRTIPSAPGMWAAFALLGFLNNLVPFSLIAFGETQIGSGLAAVYNATTPLFTALIAHLATRDERLSPLKVTGIAVGFGGVLVMLGPSALRGFNAAALAQLAVVGAALSYGCAAIYSRRFNAQGIDPLVLSAGQLCASTLLALPLVLFFDHPWTLGHGLSPLVWAAVLGLAIPSTALAYVMYFRIVATAGATNAASVTFLVPVSALLLGTLVLGERLALNSIVGMLAVFAGLAAIDGRPFGAIATWQGRRRRS
jgi:drug/metabolite transporter (DMT)-like permease